VHNVFPLHIQVSSVGEHLGTWSPLPLPELVNLFADAGFHWWIAGGYAIELALGRSLRPHSDIDVLVLRRDIVQLRSLLSAWDCWVADPPGQLRAWPLGEDLIPGLHDVWCRESTRSHWRFQIMIDEADGDEWVSRRDAAVRSPLSAITRTSDEAIPYLACHVQLYYKAKNSRPKDQVDFDAVVDAGVVDDIKWLDSAIRSTYGGEHPWLALLS